MKRQKVLAIGLDGFDVTLGERLMAEGQMPALAELRKRSARFPLDEGADRRAGLPWEHIASGLSPKDAHRWSGVDFDPSTYTAYQDGAHFAPWWAKTDLRVVVLDTPFVDLRRAPNTRGIVGWGAHNAGATPFSRPATLLNEFVLRYDEYPATEWTYGTPWPSAKRARLMGEALCKGLEVRGRAAQWLAVDRLPDWDLFFTVTSELHGGSEGLWHGVDASHPLNTHPSAEEAAAALLEVYRAIDRMVGQLVDVAGDAAILAFNLGGMCSNTSDVQSMVLLPELLYRQAFGCSLLEVPPEWAAHPDRLPMLEEGGTWDTLRGSWVPEPQRPASVPGGPSALRAVARRLPEPVKAALKSARSAAAGWFSPSVDLERENLDYIPGYHYRHYWPQMQAFAFPSFLDGRVRVNLRGRERDGIVEPSQYEDTLAMVETLLGECRDPRTGEPSVAAMDRPFTANPMSVPNSEGDLLVVWSNVAAAIEHPRLGLIGPVPIRRTGGHTSNGIAYLSAPGLEPGDRDVQPSSGVAATLVDLLGTTPSVQLSGKSFLSAPLKTVVPDFALSPR